MPPGQEHGNAGEGHAQDAHQAEDVAAHPIVDGDVCLVGKGRLDADGQLQGAGAESHYGQRDDQR
jgi:hypothetical protein